MVYVHTLAFVQCLRAASCGKRLWETFVVTEGRTLLVRTQSSSITKKALLKKIYTMILYPFIYSIQAGVPVAWDGTKSTSYFERKFCSGISGLLVLDWCHAFLIRVSLFLCTKHFPWWLNNDCHSWYNIFTTIIISIASHYLRPATTVVSRKYAPPLAHKPPPCIFSANSHLGIFIPRISPPQKKTYPAIEILISLPN